MDKTVDDDRRTAPPSVPLGKMKRCDPRVIWPNEAACFTPWLAEHENMARLADALGLTLEVENVEVAVGPYSADILARNTSTGQCVVIENQLARTDHDHLGKVITYGACLTAGDVVWIATEFTEEHRKAIEWLNDHTTDDVAFYAVQLELWRIDESRPAPVFNVISRPSKIVREAAIAKVSEPRELKLAFWTRVQERLLAARVVRRAKKIRGEVWFDVPAGRSGFVLSNIASTREGRVGVRLMLKTPVVKQALPLLLKQKEEIEREIGAQLYWDPHPENIEKCIAIYHEADLWSRDKWDQYINWLVEMVRLFLKVFTPRIKRLNLQDRG